MQGSEDDLRPVANRGEVDPNWADLAGATGPRKESPDTEDTSDGPECEVYWPVNGAERARAVSKRSNYRTTGKLPLRKAGRMVQWESTLERDALILFDAWGAVESFGEQPAKLCLKFKDEELIHFPDTLLVFSDRSAFVEIKEAVEAETAEVKERTQIVGSALTRLGFGYCVLTESTIRSQPRLRNVQMIRRFSAVRVGVLEREAVRRWFANNGEHRTLGEVKQHENAEQLQGWIFALLYDGCIDVDLHERWTSETVLRSRL